MEYTQEALAYHTNPPGKISIISTKSTKTAKDLALTYTPGVAEVSNEIHKDPTSAYKYTSKANLVAVISNGTAVLGLGNIGALAAKPVMEGKAVLFKKFGNVDTIDIEVDEQDPQKFIDIVKAISPTFGGINLEDIKAPDCFFIEKELITSLSIPVFHDDQHGTAIVIAAGLINSLEIQEKNLNECKIVFSGAGSAAIAAADLLIELGAKKNSIFMFDSKGLITTNREVNEYKAKYAQNETRTLNEALTSADVFIGVSKGNLLTKEMVQLMNDKPIIFAMANPIPEIMPQLAREASSNAIIATGRSDFANQVNNVLCFPFLFRGALDVQATTITNSMKKAAVFALADIAKQPVPKEVEEAYNKTFEFGREYIIPTPFDPRLMNIAQAVAKEAINSGVATRPLENKSV